jgi:CRP/FNR family transcriptional regulator, cyclic AMP receptor protein
MMSEEGREFVITYLLRDEFFGELAVLTDEPRSADAISVGPATLFSMSQERFNHCLGLPTFSKVVMTILARRLYTSSCKFSELILYNIYRNVLNILKDLATTQDIDGRKIQVIEKRPTHQEIAALVGSSREVITRTLKELQRNKCIKIEGRRVILLPREI